MNEITLTYDTLTSTSTAGLPALVQGIASAVGAKNWLALSGWIVGVLLFLADWFDILRLVSGTARTAVVVVLAAAIAWAAAAVLPGTTAPAVIGAAVMAAISAGLRPPAIILARFDRAAGES